MFVLSFFLRWQYVAGSEEMVHLLQDAARYFTNAYNLWHHDAHSLDPPAMQEPKTRTDHTPGFPLFLTLFFEDPPDSRTIKPQVQMAQAVMGSMTVVATLLLAALCLPFGWAMLAAVLVAINPHHIALAQVMLTETLYTFLLMLGLLAAIYGWRYSKLLLVLAGMAMLGFSGHVRMIGFVVPAVLAPLLLLAPAAVASRSLVERCKVGGAGLIGLALVYFWYQQFSAQYMQAPPATEVVMEEGWTKVKPAETYVTTSATPPRFFVEGVSHVIPQNGDPKLRYRTRQSFSEVPGSYLLWNCCGRWVYSWHFDNVYNGGAEIYPMRKSAFIDNGLQRVLHDLMLWAHWPLYALAAAGGFFVVFTSLKQLLRGRCSDAFLVSASFLGFVVALNIIHYLPRYTIPMRPLSYVLASLALYSFVSWLLQRRQFKMGIQSQR
ncbi:MAG: hypothetical protein AAGI11_10765 [Pseudomonadota bacterium]